MTAKEKAEKIVMIYEQDGERDSLCIGIDCEGCPCDKVFRCESDNRKARYVFCKHYLEDHTEHVFTGKYKVGDKVVPIKKSSIRAITVPHGKSTPVYVIGECYYYEDDLKPAEDWRPIPQKKKVPYNINDANFLIGKIIRDRSSEDVWTIIGVERDGVYTDHRIAYGALKLYYSFSDGSPCYKEIDD